MLMGTTMCAKKGLMADKIRSRLEAKYGKQMDEAADLAVELLAKKMEQQEDCSAGLEEAEQKLKDIFKQG